MIFALLSFFVISRHQRRLSFFNQRSSQNAAVGRQSNRRGDQGGSRGNGIRRGQGKGYNQTVGEIISLDDKSMTLKLSDGTSRLVTFSDTLTINQSSEAAKSDLKSGLMVAVHGVTNSDASVTGENIQINPHFLSVNPVSNR